MHWTGWIVVALVVLNAGWMLFDGSRALIVGDYVTPKTGPHAGRLGPWAGVVAAAGIAPRSTLMKTIFIVYGAGFLSITVAFMLGIRGSWHAMIAFAVLGLWHLPFGTLINVIVLVLLFAGPMRMMR